MGGILACIRRPFVEGKQPEKKISNGSRRRNVPLEPSVRTSFRSSSASADKKHDFTGVEYTTLEDFLLASPNMNAHPVHVFNQLAKKVHPSPSPNDSGQEILTPTCGLSADGLGKVDEGEEVDEGLASENNTPSRVGSGKLKKKVSFRLPGEADVYTYYAPKENPF